MSLFNVIFYGDSNSRIFNIDVLAKEWQLMKAGDSTVVKFFKEDGNVLAIFRWDTIVGICNVTGLRRENEEIIQSEEVSYENVEM